MRILTVILLLAVVTVSGCGVLNNSDHGSDIDPVIDDMRFVPTSASVGELGETKEVVVLIDYFHETRDIVKIYINDGSGLADEIEISGQDSDSGIIGFKTKVDISRDWVYRYDIVAEDSNGNKSKRIDQSFTVGNPY